MIKKVLVTGANGFIGSRVAAELIEAGYAVRGLVRERSDLRSLQGVDIERVRGDMLEPESLRPAMEGIDWVFHTAGAFRYWGEGLDQLVRHATLGIENVLRGAAKAGVQRVVLTSSSVSLGAPTEPRAVDEEYQTSDAPENKYVASKREQERLAFQLARNLGLELCAVCPTLTIGSPDYGPTESTRMILSYLQDPMKTSWIGGCNLVAVEDVARAHRLVAEKGEAGCRYLAGSDNMEWKTVHGWISELCGLPGPYLTTWHSAAYLGAALQEAWARLSGKPPLAGREQARMVGRYYWYRSDRLQELGYRPLPSREALAHALEGLVRSEHITAALRAEMQLSEDVYQIRTQRWNSEP